MDTEGIFALDNVDVNGVIREPDTLESLYYICALLNSALVNMLFTLISGRFNSDYYSANKQFLAPLPFASVNFTTPEPQRGASFLPINLANPDNHISPLEVNRVSAKPTSS